MAREYRVPTGAANSGSLSVMARPKLDDAAIDAFLSTAPAWSRKGDAIVREYKAPTARHAIRAFGRIADLAEGANHHPELMWVYNSLSILLTTHDSDGITSRDTHLAKCIDDVLE